MSAADDVLDMRDLCAEIAAREVGNGPAKARISAVSRSLGIGWNRALEFLNGKARRVDAWEKDNARRRLAELRERERIERENEHLRWLECEIARHRASGEELRGPLVDGLEHVLRAARGETGAVALQASDDRPSQH